jgi:epoxyqueuosine reductase
MTKYHSTLSRREFLKMLGLGSASFTASAVAPSVFHDLDEVMASPLADFKRPSYIRVVEKPTVEIDWGMMQRFDYTEVMWANGLRKALGPDQYDLVFKVQQENRIKWIKDNKPGYTLKDDAMLNSTHWAPATFLGPKTSQTPEEIGVPRYEGTSEENSRMVRAYLRLHGASQVGFVRLEPDTTEKLIYSYDFGNLQQRFQQGPKLVFADVDQPSETDAVRIIPRKARWVIVYTIRMADELMRFAPTQLGETTTYVAYNLKTLIQGQLQNFLRGLGYMGLGEATQYNALGSAVGLGVMAGLGEQCRLMHLMTPEYGTRQRVFKLITDLPLISGKPIDFGVMHFCRVCKKCADFCPVKAIPNDTEPNWEVRGAYQNPGVRIWRRNDPVCNAYMRQAGYPEGCAICFAVCPLSKGNRQAFVHDFMRTTISKTPVLDRFFRNMDDFLGYGIRNDPALFWNLDLPPFGWK